MKTKNFSILIGIFGFWFSAFGLAEAAVLYLEPSGGSYRSGDTFVASLRIDTEKECVNTVSVDLSFPEDILEIVDFSQGDSILTLWVKPPSLDQAAGSVAFAGGIPGGYCGYILGDPGESNLLGRVIFRVKEVGEGGASARVKFLNTSQVLLNDGFGTPAELNTRGAEFTISPKSLDSVQVKDEWQEELADDNIPPEDFKIAVERNEAIFEGKYFVAFSTTDKQTGVDYYEVKEGGKDWLKTTSPYLLEDQRLRSTIRVRAVDKAGNYVIAEKAPINKPISYQYLAAVIILMIGGAAWFIRRKIRRTP